MQDVDLERVVLPALLALLILGMFLILVTSGGGGNDSLAPVAPAQPVRAETTAERPARSSAPAPRAATAPTGRFARVAQGDTATSIAQRAGLTLNRLAELNPSVDLDSLRLGQTLKLLP